MPRKRKTATKKAFKFNGFINCNLSSDEAEACLNWTPSSETIFNEIERLANSGFKVSFGHDEKNDCFQANMTCVDMDNPGGGYVLSGRGSDLYNAVRSLLFKHTEMLEGSWENEVTREFETREVW